MYLARLISRSNSLDFALEDFATAGETQLRERRSQSLQGFLTA